MAGHLLDTPERPKFVRVAPPAGHSSEGNVGPVGGNSGYGPYFGSVPDFGEGVPGVKFASVESDSHRRNYDFEAAHPGTPAITPRKTKIQ